jgi:hypothetical protein
VVYTPDEDDGSTSAQELKEKGYTLPEYHFVAEYKGTESEPSKLLYIKSWVEVPLQKIKFPSGINVLLRFPDGTEKEIDTASGNPTVDYVPIGYAELIIL